MRTKIVTAWVMCSLVVAGGLIITFSPPSADALFIEPTVNTLGEKFWAGAMNIGPSPFLLFSMGALGIGCVLINERRYHRCRSRQGDEGIPCSRP